MTLHEIDLFSFVTGLFRSNKTDESKNETPILKKDKNDEKKDVPSDDGEKEPPIILKR